MNSLNNLTVYSSKLDDHKGATMMFSCANFALLIVVSGLIINDVASQSSFEDDLVFKQLTETLLDPYQGYEADELVNKSPIELIKLRGFDVENHYVTTRDGYKVNVVRIVNKELPKNLELKRPVIFNHGFLNTATMWLINSRDFKARDFSDEQCNQTSASVQLDGFDRYMNGPMMLSNAGHDVYLMSMRGTEFSGGNIWLNTSEPKFWDFSLDNFALIDLPTVISYVRKLTKRAKVGYVGFSQATFCVFGLLSKLPQYADIIEPVVAIAPVAYFHHVSSILRPLFINEAETNSDGLDGPFPQNASSIRKAQGEVCSIYIGSSTCSLANAMTSGPGARWPRGYFAHLPFQSSLKVVRHFGQLIINKQFEMYDYGPEVNLERYGQEEVLEYNIGAIRSMSMCLFSGSLDALSTPEDIKLFVGDLKVPLLKVVTVDKFNHIDLITHPKASERVFKPMLRIFNSFEDKNCKI